MPTGTEQVAGSLEVSNRWKTFGGNEDLYRSIVDLGEGPKLANLNLRYRSRGEPATPLLDSADVRLTSWGGEPSSTLHVEWSRRDDYEAVVSYRRFAYFNRIPSLANPTPGFAGPAQQWLDIDRGLFDAELTILPRGQIVPFLAVSRDSAKGPGRTTFVEDANEFSVSSMTDTYNNTFRGGLRFRFERWTATIEGGTSAFDDSQSLQFSGNSSGNRTALFLGRRLRLTDLDQAYRIRGSNRFARIRVEARPWTTLTFFGQFAFSQPEATLGFTSNSSGDFVLLRTLAAYTGGAALGMGESTLARPSGAAGVEWRPRDGLRIVESVSFERFHVDGSAETQRELTPTLSLTETGDQRLRSNLTRHRIDASWELNRRLTVHGGHSFVDADAISPGSRLSGSEKRSFGRHTTRAGVTVRPFDRLDVRTDFELERDDNVYFRTDRRRFGRVVMRGRYRVTDALTATLYGSLWNNTNEPSVSTLLDDSLVQHNRHAGAELSYSPGISWLEAVHAGYERSTFSSDVDFLIPQNFQSASSAYRERGHSSTITALVHPLDRVDLDLGGSLFVSTEENDTGARARPTRFYDARARISVEVIPELIWNGDWRWLGYSNRALPAERFETHLIATGLTYVF